MRNGKRENRPKSEFVASTNDNARRPKNALVQALRCHLWKEFYHVEDSSLSSPGTTSYTRRIELLMERIWYTISANDSGK